jgi:acyl-CoA synthetase (AMP-forming)/AMP-acid ligase II
VTTTYVRSSTTCPRHDHRPESWRPSRTATWRERSPRTDLRVIALDLPNTPGERLSLSTNDPAGLPDPRRIRTTAGGGTTGKQKGARHSDASLIASSSSMTGRLGITDGDVYPIVWPMTHVGGAMTSAVLRNGGNLVLFDSFGSASYGDLVAAVGPTILGAGTVFFRAYIEAQRRLGTPEQVEFVGEIPRTPWERSARRTCAVT